MESSSAPIVTSNDDGVLILNPVAREIQESRAYPPLEQLEAELEEIEHRGDASTFWQRFYDALEIKINLGVISLDLKKLLDSYRTPE
jgi:hypothetical protein